LSNKWPSVTSAKGRYVAGGYGSGQAARVAVATEPGDWTIRDTGYVMYMNDVVYGAGKFVCDGYGGVAQPSPDGLTWSTPLDAAPGNWLKRVLYAGGQFVAVGES